MSNIADIDKNFKIDTKIDKSDIRFINALTEPFKIYGIYYENGKFRRMPEAVAKAVSEGVYYLHANTAGGRIRFKTDSTYVAISARLARITRMDHFTLCGSAGFDLYVDGTYLKTFRPPYDMTDGYENVLEIGEKKMRDITINFPLYTDVCELYIGISESAEILEPTPYKNEKPVVFYGSSITQGGCASRPGTSYQNFICRELNVDYVNLGFSGNAKAEDEMIEYISSLDMSVFVYDYDFNAPTLEHLEKTHEKMFLAIREAHPSLPVIIMSMPKYRLDEVQKKRFEVIKRTYDNAVDRGDENVYLIPGPALMEFAGSEGTVDWTHPNDFGFYSMAKVIANLLKKIDF